MTTAEILTPILAVLGSVTGVASLSWNIFTYFNQVKPKFEYRLWVDATKRPTVRLTVSNTSRVPVYIDSITLNYFNAPSHVSHVFRTISTRGLGPTNDTSALQPYAGREYYLVLSNANELGDTESAFPYKYWISISSPTKVIMKIRGSEVLGCLRGLQRAQKASESEPTA